MCIDLEGAVSELHKTLFQDEDYRVTNTVSEISKQIQINTATYKK